MKQIRTCVLALLTAFSLTFLPQKSNAAAGSVMMAASGAAYLALTGGSMAVISSIGFNQPGTNKGTLLFFFWIGLIILDADGKHISLQALNAENSSRFSISSSEQTAFNNELPAINLLISELTASLSENPAMNTESQSKLRTELVSDLGISASALSAMAKLGSGLTN